MHSHLNVKLIRQVALSRILNPVVCLISILIINNMVIKLNN